ncbi:MAG: AbrB/MazE/SpoVT family DNA-binding domain-containing protein [Promethearchaeota archaeon]
MVKEVKTVAKIIKIGNSLGNTIGKDVCDILDLKPGDYIQLTIEKIEKKESKE